MRALRNAAALAAAVTLAAGCGGGARATPAKTPGAGEGRPIGAVPSASAQAVATAVRFARGYLLVQAGRLPVGRLPDAAPELIAGLKHLRVPPAQRFRHAAIVGADLNRIDARGARATVRVRNLDERLTYPLPLDLERRAGRWIIVNTGDDL
jgi:hypothetical protein